MGRQQAFGGLVGPAWSTGKPPFSPGTGKKKSQPDEGWDFTLW